MESGHAGTAHRARSPDGTEEPGAGLPARDGRDHRGEAAGDPCRQARPGARRARYAIRRAAGRARIGHGGAEAAPRSVARRETPRSGGRDGEAAPTAGSGAAPGALARGGAQGAASAPGGYLTWRDDPAASGDERAGANDQGAPGSAPDE